jgi:uncharacterized membrane protein YhaH (DUF805 family)
MNEDGGTLFPSEGRPKGLTDCVKVTLHARSSKGRANRGEYWWFQLAVTLAVILIEIIGFVLGRISSPIYTLFLIAFSVACVLVTIASVLLSIRRLHDIDRNGWTLLLALIPLVGSIILLVFYMQPGTNGTNKYGPSRG